MPDTATREKVSEAAEIARGDLAEFIKTRVRPRRPELTEQQRELVKTLRRDGFAVVENYWPRERAFSVRDRLETELEPGESVDFDNGAYTRFQDNADYDEGVRRIYHVERLLPELTEFRHDPFVLDIASAYYGVDFHTGLLIFQHNTRSNANTRFHHVDSFHKEFKSFLYLDDVDEGNGPFTYMRGTQRSHLRRIRRQIDAKREGPATSFSPDDVDFASEREVQICGRAGTLILADVRGLHRGSPQLEGSRSVLVNYIVRHQGDLLLAK